MSEKKTLKDLKDTINKVSVSNLERQFMFTAIAKYGFVLEDYCKNKIKRKDFEIPTLQRLLNDCIPGYAKDAEQIYINKMKDYPGYERVNVATMVSQGALFDNLCFVYDMVKDNVCLATMNFELLYNLDVEYDMLKQVLTKNLKGIVKAYRIDIEYSNSESGFTFKAVNARDFDIDEPKDDGVEGKRFFVIPYIYILRYMKILEQLLKNRTLTVLQDVGGIEKVRVISLDEDILAKFCDNPNAVKGLKSRFFPLKAFFYAPSVGSPSTTAMVTNINLFNVSNIKPTSEYDFKKYNIQKPANPIKSIVGESVVCNVLMDLKSKDLNAFSDIIDSFPNRKLYLSENVEEIDVRGISKFLHSLSNVGLNKVYKKLGLVEEINRREKLISSNECRQITSDDMKNLEDILKDNVCRLVIQKKDCRLSSVFCTNNKEILKGIYGDDYFGKYEGFSAKFYEFWNWVNDVNNTHWGVTSIVSDKLVDCGLTLPKQDVDILVNKIIATKYGKISKEEGKDIIKAFIADSVGASLKRSQSANKGNNILVRTLKSSIDADGKPYDYYKYLDKSKIISGIIL